MSKTNCYVILLHNGFIPLLPHALIEENEIIGERNIYVTLCNDIIQYEDNVIILFLLCSEQLMISTFGFLESCHWL